MVRRIGRRQGISLLEVIIALAVFLMSITGLVFLMGIATDNAIETQMRSQAQSLCQSKLAEVSAGALPLSGTSKAECEDDKDYQWSMEVTPGAFASLSTVTVTVSRKRANGKEFECSMSQMVLDPSVTGTVFDGAKAMQTPDTSGGTTDPSSSASTTPSASASPSAAAPKSGPAGSSPKSGTMSPSAAPKSGGSSPTPSPRAGGSSPKGS
jgi:general secretion pathway protein I